MPELLRDRRRIVQRLQAEGWVNRGGGEHDIFTREGQSLAVAVPRHRGDLSPGVARAIAKAAGWR